MGDRSKPRRLGEAKKVRRGRQAYFVTSALQLATDRGARSISPRVPKLASANFIADPSAWNLPASPVYKRIRPILSVNGLRASESVVRATDLAAIKLDQIRDEVYAVAG